MQGIYVCLPETNHVSRVYSFAAILYLQFVLHVMLFPMLHVLYTFFYFLKYVCSAQCGFFFCSSSIMCFHNMLLRYFMNDFEMVPVAPILLVSLLFLHSRCTVFLL